MKGKRLRLSTLAGWLGLALLCGVSLYLILAWNTLPTQIPGHFNAAGAIDRWGSRTELWVCPVVGLVLWGALTLLELVFRRWNWEGEGLSPPAPPTACAAPCPTLWGDAVWHCLRCSP